MRLRISYANVVSTLALVLVVGGGAYAATQLPKDSVGSKQVKNSSLRSKDVKDGNLRATDLKAGAIDAEVAGTPMGGDLAGTFPDPTLRPSLLAGLATDVELANGLDDAQNIFEAGLADLREDAVIGERASGSASLAARRRDGRAGQPADVVTVSASCFEAGPNQGLNVEVSQRGPGADWSTSCASSRRCPPSTASPVTSSGQATTSISSSRRHHTQSARYLQLTVYGGSPLTIEVAGITSTLAGTALPAAQLCSTHGPV